WNGGSEERGLVGGAHFGFERRQFAKPTRRVRSRANARGDGASGAFVTANLVPRLRLGTHCRGGSASRQFDSAGNILARRSRGRASQAVRSQAEPGNESVFVIHHSSFIIHHSSFIIRHSSFVIRHSSFVIPHSS